MIEMQAWQMPWQFCQMQQHSFMYYRDRPKFSKRRSSVKCLNLQNFKILFSKKCFSKVI